MNLPLTILLTIASVSAGTSLSFWLLHKAHDVDTSVWVLEHVICPIIRIVVLLSVVSLVYPTINAESSPWEFWQVLSQQGQFNLLLNILFFGGLAMSFLPILSHPVVALPTQSMLTIALVFSWQYASEISAAQLFPSFATIGKLVLYMLFAYFVTHHASIQLSRWIDRRYAIEGSIRLVSDAFYMILQIPVMLIYCSFLRQQLGV